MDPAPIIVPNSSVPSQFITAGQYVVTFLSGIAVAHKWLGEDDAAQVIAAVPAVLAGVYGIYRAWVNIHEKTTIVTSPDTVIPPAVASMKGS